MKLRTPRYLLKALLNGPVHPTFIVLITFMILVVLSLLLLLLLLSLIIIIIIIIIINICCSFFSEVGQFADCKGLKPRNVNDNMTVVHPRSRKGLTTFVSIKFIFIGIFHCDVNPRYLRKHFVKLLKVIS